MFAASVYKKYFDIWRSLGVAPFETNSETLNTKPLTGGPLYYYYICNVIFLGHTFIKQGFALAKGLTDETTSTVDLMIQVGWFIGAAVMCHLVANQFWYRHEISSLITMLCKLERNVAGNIGQN